MRLKQKRNVHLIRFLLKHLDFFFASSLHLSALGASEREREREVFFRQFIAFYCLLVAIAMYCKRFFFNFFPFTQSDKSGTKLRDNERFYSHRIASYRNELHHRCPCGRRNHRRILATDERNALSPICTSF